VTFLFTDIEGSTRLWEQAPEPMRAALVRHDELIRSAVVSAGGTVFATGGDGVAAAFGRASDGVNAAVAAQRALQAVDWPEGVTLRVRMGLHTGEADERDGDYFGPPVNRAARVMSAGHGGQIVLSDVTASVLGQVPGVRLIDLGSHRLKGLADVMQVFGVDADGLPWIDRPLVTDQAVDGNLPRPATEFVGRIDALQQRIIELAAHRLVTLTGSGGVGKTRLAVEVGWLAAEQFPGGVWVADLSTIGDGDAVSTTVLTTLGAQVQLGMSVTATIVEWLRARRTLLIIDNCEHVLDGAASLVAAILAGSPTTTVLATSREPLGVSGETVRVVPSLPIEVEAVELFVQRAASASEAFVLNETTRPTVEALCSRLDGIPLAIELAAARVRSLSPTEILARLDDRFRLLRSSGRGGQERHQTLQATVDWSYQLLDDDAKHLFDRLSVFAGSFDLDATEAVCGVEPLDPLDIVDLLAGLVDKSMVLAETGRDGTTRYRLLETMRQFGETRQAAGTEASGIRDRHLRYYRGLAERTFALQATAAEAEAVARFDTEWANLRAAFDWSIATNQDDDTDEILYSTCFYSFHTLRWEHSDWAQRATASWLTRDVNPWLADAASITWAAFAGDFGRVTELCSALPLDVSAMSPRDHDTVQRAYAWLRHQDEQPVDPYSHAWTIHHLAMAFGALPIEDLKALLHDLDHLATVHDAPSLRAISHSVSGINATLAGADSDAIDSFRRCAESADIVGSTFIAGNCRSWLRGLLARGPASNAGELRTILEDHVATRITMLIPPAFPTLSFWFARIGDQQTAALLLGVTEAHPPLDPTGVATAMALEAAQLLVDLPKLDELTRQGAAMSLDEAVAMTLAALTRIEHSLTDPPSRSE
jgi:predicted ATPase/class 3 adenylate cyclase